MECSKVATKTQKQKVTQRKFIIDSEVFATAVHCRYILLVMVGGTPTME